MKTKIDAPKTLSFSGELLLKMKNEGTISEISLDLLRRTADKHVASEALVVTKRNSRAVTGDPHDYSSVGPYWWPNPETPNGLPYIRRDGEIIPGSIEKITPRLVARKIFELALAAFYFESEEYGRASVKAIYDWHLNPETYMTPHAEYAQSIPGICTGRGIGIVDFAYSYQIFDAVAILEFMGYIDEKTVTDLKKWYTDFTDWMLTSENALTEDTELNNHGTFYDLQVLSMAIFTGRDALIKKICTTAYERRVREQIGIDGRQPLELARTMAMHYSLANIRGLCMISNMALANGYVNFISDDTERGYCIIKSAIDYIYPYVLDPKSFPYKESHSAEVYPSIQDMMIMALKWADGHFWGEGYAELEKKIRVTNPIWFIHPYN